MDKKCAYFIILSTSYLGVFPIRGRSQTTFTRFGFFDHLPPSVYIFYGIKVYKKSIFLTTYPLPLVNVVRERPLSIIVLHFQISHRNSEQICKQNTRSIFDFPYLITFLKILDQTCFEVDTGVVVHLAFVLGKQPQTCEPFVKPVTVASNLVSELLEASHILCKHIFSHF